MKTKKQAFTIIDLLVTIIIIGLIFTILLPIINKIKSRARDIVCLSNERQVFTVIAGWSDRYEWVDLKCPNDKTRWTNSYYYSGPYPRAIWVMESDYFHKKGGNRVSFVLLNGGLIKVREDQMEEFITREWQGIR